MLYLYLRSIFLSYKANIVGVGIKNCHSLKYTKRLIYLKISKLAHYFLHFLSINQLNHKNCILYNNSIKLSFLFVVFTVKNETGLA